MVRLLDFLEYAEQNDITRHKGEGSSHEEHAPEPQGAPTRTVESSGKLELRLEQGEIQGRVRCGPFVHYGVPVYREVLARVLPKPLDQLTTADIAKTYDVQDIVIETYTKKDGTPARRVVSLKLLHP